MSTNLSAPSPTPSVSDRYTCGTLSYTLRSLAAVFIWIMIGGMCLSVCTQLPGQLLPIKLVELGSSDQQKALILSTIGMVLNFTVCPIVGFKSDRYRSRLGRRIPFILVSLPFITMALLLFGWGDRLGSWLSGAVAPFAQVAPVTMTIGLIAVVMFIFQFANMFVNSVFWYIFNDVIPAQFFGRIMGAFQIASAAGMAAFQYFIFEHARAYYTQIFIGAGILYTIGMGLMCLMVKEGEYPPVEGESEQKKSWLDSLKLFFKESCCSRFYVLRYALTTVIAVSWGAGMIYQYNYNQEMGLSDALMGKFNAINGLLTVIATMVVTALLSFLVDRWHPMRIFIYTNLFLLTGAATGWKWIFGVLPGEVFVWVGIISTVGSVFLGVLAAIANLPMEMLSFPKSRFGSFCSAQSLIRSLVCLLFSFIIGALFDGLRAWLPISQTFNYRFVPAWSLLWMIPAFILAYVTYREWNRLGGYKNYAAPASWTSSGTEPIEQPATEVPNAALLRLALFCFDFIILLTFFGTGVLCYWANQVGQPELSTKLLLFALPCEVAVVAFWFWTRYGILRDIKRALLGEPLHNGIPHHGLLLLFALRQFVFAGIGLYQVWLLGNSGGFAFMMAEIVMSFLVVLTLFVIARMERGIVTEVTPGGNFKNWLRREKSSLKQIEDEWLKS